MRKFTIPIVPRREDSEASPPRVDHTSCENCLCASCERLCMKCTRSCSPMNGRYVPLIGCPDYVNMRTAIPLRYTYRGGADVEYRLHLSS